MPDDMYWSWRGKRYAREFVDMPDGMAADFHRQENIIIDEIAKLEGVRYAMEVGCGFGRVANALTNVFPCMYVSGFDPSLDQVLEARLRQCTSASGSFYQSDWHMLERLYRRFDLVYSVEVLMHIRDPWPVMRSMLLASKRYVLHCELDDGLGRSRRNYRHDYAGIYRSHGIPARIAAAAPFGQLITVAERPQ